MPTALPGQFGGEWIFSPPPFSGFTRVILGINNGVAPLFPTPSAGALNIEVFTNATVAGQPGIPNPDAGFLASLVDANFGIDSGGFLVGTDLRLGSGDYLIVDSVTGATTQSAAKIILGTGYQTVVGAKFDTLVGGQQSVIASQILSALVGNETVIGGAVSRESIWGGANDSIVAGSGANQQIVVDGSGATILTGIGGKATISALGQGNTIKSISGSVQNVAMVVGPKNLIDLTGSTGVDLVIGANGDTITGGDGVTNVQATDGDILITVGANGTTNISGNFSQIVGNTIIGSTGNLVYNPYLAPGIAKGDLINLSGSTGTATINAFSVGLTSIDHPDTILGSNNADSVFGGNGDRIGTGNGLAVGGTHQWIHADTMPGSSVGFGSNDMVASTSYDTVAATATRGTVAGTSSAQVTVGGFNVTADFLFYQNETAATNGAIIATAQAVSVGGAAGSLVTLPDGTIMTLVGITPVQLTIALGAGTLFRP